jgi:hypothetical protein
MDTLARFPVPPRSAGFDRQGCARDPGAARDYLKPFHDMAAMIGLIDRLPDLADDIGRWRPPGSSERFTGAAQRGIDEISRIFDGFHPLMRRAFEAVATALGKLAEAAADLCARAQHPLTPDELEACAAIGRSMRRLLDRAAALVDSADALLAHSADLAPIHRLSSRAEREGRPELTFLPHQELTFL